MTVGKLAELTGLTTSAVTKATLSEAEYSFNYIGTELVDLTDKVEDVANEIKNLSLKIDKMEKSLVEKAKAIFNEQYTKIVRAIITTIYAVEFFRRKIRKYDYSFYHYSRSIRCDYHHYLIE